MNSSQKIRARAVFGLISIAALVLGGTLYWTQIVKGSEYAARADRQYARPRLSIFDRGSIFFHSKDGTLAAAADVSKGSLVYMNPSVLADPEQAFQALSAYVDLDRSDFFRKAAKKDDRYEELASKIPSTEALTIKNLKIAGIEVAEDKWRSYPGGKIAAHELGLIGEDASSTMAVGRYGLERTYQSTLARGQSMTDVNVFAGLFSDIRNTVFGSLDGEEGDIVTTIDPTTQRYLEKVIDETAALWKSDEIGGIIIDPRSGEIVAMSSLPTFDPNKTGDVTDIKVLSNPLVEHSYEMGSIVKPLTMAVALDTGAVRPDSTYDDTGTMTLSGKKISNFDGRARGVVSMQEILSQSLNVGVATIALEVGKTDFYKYISSFGMGQKTGIDLPNEATGIIGNLKTGRDIEIATAAFGQGIAVSPINMARALSILANGGYVVTPHLVKRIDYEDGTSKDIDPKPAGPVLKKETTDQVTQMLVNVVDKALKNGVLKMDHHSIAAKTGTAQIPDHATGGYYTDRYLHSFFGYFPAYDPKFLVFLYHVNPKGAEYASATLTDPFEQLAKFLITYYNIPPDR